eukprot:TRINITY_DN2196_c0_g2_i1.p1 TRINITY_DN2196_c0_g2~~TRINITY_DN2196_c0_g2_i1.p1  ORF type:complete len:124 (+),score=19.66 TRINITY_DN2196_c0_g2_i1:52-372(+)
MHKFDEQEISSIHSLLSKHFSLTELPPEPTHHNTPPLTDSHLEYQYTQLDDIFGQDHWLLEGKNVQFDLDQQIDDCKWRCGCSVFVRLSTQDGGCHEDIGFLFTCC